MFLTNVTFDGQGDECVGGALENAEVEGSNVEEVSSLGVKKEVCFAV